jgi:hypothetical protein
MLALCMHRATRSKRLRAATDIALLFGGCLAIFEYVCIFKFVCLSVMLLP